MDTIKEALEQIHYSEEARSNDGRSLFIGRAHVLATIALAEQIERVADHFEKSKEPGKRIIVTVNDDTTQDQIDTLTKSITLMSDQLKITAVIVYEQA